jgi:hypothetical protein
VVDGSLTRLAWQGLGGHRDIYLLQKALHDTRPYEEANPEDTYRVYQLFLMRVYEMVKARADLKSVMATALRRCVPLGPQSPVPGKHSGQNIHSGQPLRQREQGAAAQGTWRGGLGLPSRGALYTNYINASLSGGWAAIRSLSPPCRRTTLQSKDERSLGRLWGGPPGVPGISRA